ncbi:MAG: hypothetical protein V1866_05635 [archaeon]
MVKGVRVRAVLLALALLACFILAYIPHIHHPYSFIDPENAALISAERHPFPFHNDEWAHMATGLAIADEGKLNFNPYLGTSISDRELGFHLFLAGIFLLPKINAVLVYQYLAPLFLAINALFLFLLVRRLTKSYWIGLFSILFLASLRSNTNFTGNWFFTPMTFSLFLVFLFLHCFIKALDNGKQKTLLLVISAIIFALEIFVYPIAAVLTAVLAFSYALSALPKKGFVKDNLKDIIFFGAMGLLLALFVIRNHFWAGSISLTFSKFMGELVFRKGWTALEHSYSLLSIYGTTAMLLACIGAAYAVIKRKSPLFIIWPAILLLNLLVFMVFRISLLMPYQRNLFYLLVGLVPLSAMGLFWISESLLIFLKKLVRAKKKGNGSRGSRLPRIAPAVPAAISAFVVLLFLLFVFKDYYRIEPVEFSLQKIITPAGYDALLWLRDNEHPYQKVLAGPFLSAAVYPISRNRVVGMMPSSLEGGNIDIWPEFMSSGCDTKEHIMREENADLVVSSEEISCQSLTRIYNKDEIFIYSLKI